VTPDPTRATNRVMATLSRPITRVATVSSAVVAAALLVAGAYQMVTGGMPFLFGLTLFAIGAIGVALAWGTWQARRAPWAFLVGLWGVVAFCAFFATPKVDTLPIRKLEVVTVEMELTMGHDKAEAEIADRNLFIRLSNLGLCLALAAPFGLMCAGLATGAREFERS